jgi:arginyl-tRNA synthetase
MNLLQQLNTEVSSALTALYNIAPATITFQETNPQFEGDVTLVVFPYLKTSGQNPEQTATTIGLAIMANTLLVQEFNVVKGFLNFSIKQSVWLEYFNQSLNELLVLPSTGKTIMVEYSSPNTNKPLHLGHVRNNLLGVSVSNILMAAGNKVVKVNIINDRGVHICKSMLAYQLYGNSETPQSAGIKGDHLVGKYYVEFDKRYKTELAALKAAGVTDEDAPKQSKLMQKVSDMLRKWEANDAAIKQLWQTMNTWVYAGFDVTYKKLGVTFDKVYYESNTYLLGKEIVEEGLAKKIFYTKPDGSTWIDLTTDKLDEKVVLRADGTSVYITQDLGTAVARAKEYAIDGMIYTVGNEQDYHFKVLFKTLEKLGYSWATNMYHLSYGMVELPEGKMKSREGTVVDADDLIQEMYNAAKQTTEELGKVDGFSAEELDLLYHQISMGALKYFILRVDPKKKMLFNPSESIDFNGNTGPFIQYTHARIQSILRKAEYNTATKLTYTLKELHTRELAVIKHLYNYASVLQEAARTYSPALVANFTYELAKLYNQFYNECQVVKEENIELKNFRLTLSHQVSKVIANGLELLGVVAPNRM